MLNGNNRVVIIVGCTVVVGNVARMFNYHILYTLMTVRIKNEASSVVQ